MTVNITASYGDVTVHPSSAPTNSEHGSEDIAFFDILFRNTTIGGLSVVMRGECASCTVTLSREPDMESCHALSVLLSSIAYRKLHAKSLCIDENGTGLKLNGLITDSNGSLHCTDPEEESFVEYYDTFELGCLSVERFSPAKKDEWDAFVKDSMNGTFLQSMKFLDYHPEGRFTDFSLMIRRKNVLVAVIPGCDMNIEGCRTFFSHRGSTYGGIIIKKEHYNIQDLKNILKITEDYLIGAGFRSLVFKPTSDLFCAEPNELIDYLLFKRGYESYSELSFFIDCSVLPDDVVESFTKHKRKHYKESLREGLIFRQFQDDGEIRTFHEMLVRNLEMHGRRPTHTVEEMLDLFHNRIGDRIQFYGVYLGDRMVSGTMLFRFSDDAIHTQYIATDYDYSGTQSTYFLYGKIIETVKKSGFKTLSWGISTESDGKYLNEGLASLKEGFGSHYSINRTYSKHWL